MSMHRIGPVLFIPKTNVFYNTEPNRKIKIVSVDTDKKVYVTEVLDGVKQGKWDAPMRYVDTNYKRVEV